MTNLLGNFLSRWTTVVVREKTFLKYFAAKVLTKTKSQTKYKVKKVTETETKRNGGPVRNVTTATQFDLLLSLFARFASGGERN